MKSENKDTSLKNSYSILRLAIISSVFFSSIVALGQEKVYNTFNAARIGNGHSTKTLWKRELDLFFGHKFGDYSNGIKNTFNATDVSFGADYGLTNNWMTGFSISKGAGPYRGLVNGFFKFKVLHQTKNETPVNISLLANASYSTMEANADPSSPVSFTNDVHRLAYTFQALISRKLNDRISIQIAPCLFHRNYVAFEDVNTMASIGFAGKYQINKLLALTTEYYLNLPNNRTVLNQTYYDPLTVGLELNTGGHVFRILFSNSPGYTESQFIPYTNSTWENGGFRLGFAFGRIFKM